MQPGSGQRPSLQLGPRTPRRSYPALRQGGYRDPRASSGNGPRRAGDARCRRILRGRRVRLEPLLLSSARVGRAGLVELGRLRRHGHQPRRDAGHLHRCHRLVGAAGSCLRGRERVLLRLLGGPRRILERLTGARADRHRIELRRSGQAVYAAWYEIVPAPSIPIKLKILPGDRITAAVLVQGTQVTLQLTNTRGARA